MLPPAEGSWCRVEGRGPWEVWMVLQAPEGHCQLRGLGPASAQALTLPSCVVPEKCPNLWAANWGCSPASLAWSE